MKLQGFLTGFGSFLISVAFIFNSCCATAVEQTMLDDAVNKTDLMDPASVNSVDFEYERLRTQWFQEYCVLQEVSRALTAVYDTQRQYPEPKQWQQAVTMEAKSNDQSYRCLSLVLERSSRVGVEYIYQDTDAVIIYSPCLVVQVNTINRYESFSLKAGTVRGKVLQITSDSYELLEPEDPTRADPPVDSRQQAPCASDGL